LHDEALAALLKTYLQLEHKLIEIRSEARTLYHQMESVRATLLVCRPDLQLAEILPSTPPAETAARRKQSVMALEVLRAAAIPLTSREVVIRLLLCQGHNNPDEAMIQGMVPNVHGALARYKKRGVVTESGKPKRWAIVA
jgi:hypothetical protein